MPLVHSYLKRRSHVHSYLKRAAAHRRHHPVAPPPPATSWTIPALCSAYNWPAGTAVGNGVIAIVELGGGWNASDVAAAFQAMNQPIPAITDVSVDGTTNSPGSDADGEVALDIQVSGASYFCATGKPATIRMYWSRDIATAVTKAAADGCDVCSISWGASESVWGSAALDAMESAAAAATAAGMVVLAASGDNSADDGGGATAVDAPASCPHVVGCGGTTKPATGAATVWGGSNPDGSKHWVRHRARWPGAGVRRHQRGCSALRWPGGRGRHQARLYHAKAVGEHRGIQPEHCGHQRGLLAAPQSWAVQWPG
jgi:hypothetical protein